MRGTEQERMVPEPGKRPAASGHGRRGREEHAPVVESAAGDPLYLRWSVVRQACGE